MRERKRRRGGAGAGRAGDGHSRKCAGKLNKTFFGFSGKLYQIFGDIWRALAQSFWQKQNWISIDKYYFIFDLFYGATK